MTTSQRRRPSRSNRAVQLTSKQLGEARTPDPKSHRSSKNLIGLAAIGVAVFVCLGSLIYKQRSVTSERDLGEVISEVDLKAGTPARNSLLTTSKDQFEASGVIMLLPGTNLKLQQYQGGKYYIYNSTTGDCVLVSGVQAGKIRNQLQRGENIGYCYRQPKEPRICHVKKPQRSYLHPHRQQVLMSLLSNWKGALKQPVSIFIPPL